MADRQIGEPDVPHGKRQIVGGRQTEPKGSVLGMLPYSYLPRRQYERYDISKFEMSHLSAASLLSILPDVSPDVGLAVWNMLRLGSAGFNFTVKDSSGQDDEKGKQLLDELLSNIGMESGGLRGLIVQWLLSAYLQGAVCGEVALTEDLRGIDDFYSVDPATIKFGRDETKKLVMYHTPPNGSLAIRLNTEKVWYVPIDPMIDDPYGRPPAAPVLQEVWFDVAFITDLRRVVHNQGWPRIDIKVLSEIIINSAPASVKNDEKELLQWMNDRLAEVQKAYSELQPDDSFAHYDSVEINQAESAGRLFDPSGVLRVIERRMIKALKQLPILMANNEGSTETHGTIQWQIFVAGLQSMQEPICTVLNRMMQLSLQVLGYKGRVECFFEPIRTSDRKADADAETAEIRNAIIKWAAGFQTWEESAIEVTGSAPPEGVEEPDPATLGIGGMQASGALAAMGAVRSDRFDKRIDAEFDLYPGR
jgi:hypothetical protein